jgi:L,D-transpeptidase catalytic domain/Putative peptidoglycan binding domain
MLGDGGTSRSARSSRALIAIAAGALLLVPNVTAHATTPPTEPPADSTTTTIESTTTTTVAPTTPATDPPPPATDPPPPPVTEPAAPPPPPPPPADIGEYRGPLPLGGCAISTVLRLNTVSNDVVCAERVLGGLGYQFAGPDEVFGLDSWYSLKDFQRNNGLRADGILGPTTGRRMGIWGTATPQPAASPAPEPAPEEPGAYGLPANSGGGRRIVYHRGQQRIWAVEADGTVVKTHLVSGRTREPYAGTYRVYSRSMYTYSAASPTIKWRYMVRFAHGPGGGNIGFHEIPTRYGVPLQSVGQLGQPLSGGCVRQSTADAQWMWNWAGVGTPVVVL